MGFSTQEAGEGKNQDDHYRDPGEQPVRSRRAAERTLGNSGVCFNTTSIHDWHMIDDGTLGEKSAIHT